MSLSLPEIYELGDINENWIAQFTADNDNCLEFDGEDDWISFGDILDQYNSFTIEAWLNAMQYRVIQHST